LSPLTRRLGLRTFGIHFLFECSLTGSFGLRFMDLDGIGSAPRRYAWVDFSDYMFNQSPLVLESVTLAKVVEFVIKMLVNLACSTILDEETS
jgi:hypothetical protein